MPNDTLTGIEGVRVGHAELSGVPSGCTVVLTDGGVPAGVDVRGGAPGTFGTDTLNPVNLVDRIHGLFFTGGSAFGLSVAEGVRRYLKEMNVGFDSGHGLIPIVAGAVIFDLGVNRSGLYPDGELGYRACRNATGEPVGEGCRGAGLGATVGKLHGMERGMKSGLGSALIDAPSGVRVGALMVVNAFGDVFDPFSNRPLAGCREDARSSRLIDAEKEMMRLRRLSGFPEGQNTVVGVVATNVRLNKTQLTKVAQMAHDGLARTVFPTHTLYDGDTVFALSCGDVEGVETTVVGALAARATAEAVLRGVYRASSLGDLPAHCDLR
ncbi:MAG: P1 family peptidase [Deltaproteobacteria bacterium]|nr:P1 family peptidase [Deltaproteobacteria bacterium]